MIGKTFFHYHIIGEYSSGGMDMVYKAEETRLKRQVALKVLPPNAIRNSEAKQRFIKEAQAASNLHHPNICTILEINESDDGKVFIANACTKGTILKEQIERARITREGAIDITLQIARGLAKAHKHGIIHGNIKPASIFITHKGIVKILDFGLARLTGQSRMIRPGQPPATAVYISPEQIKGEAVDQRTDIWSLGVLLYEMLTGELPFKALYDQSMIYAIINKEPIPIQHYDPEISQDLISIINRTLKKNPQQRYHSVDEIICDLNPLARKSGKPILYRDKEEDFSPKIKPDGVEKPKKRMKKITIRALVSLIFLITSVLLYILYFPYPRFIFSLEEANFKAFTRDAGLEHSPCFSPDGSQIAYSWLSDNEKKWTIYIKMVDTGSARELTTGIVPAWSPDGQKIAFINNLSRSAFSVCIIPVENGSVQKIAEFQSNNVLWGSGAPLYDVHWHPNGLWLTVSAAKKRNAPHAIYLLNVNTGQNTR
jgi:serine/threonine protein kinase